jgi:hypothetical protein
MGRPEDRERKDLLTEVVICVDAGRLGWTLEGDEAHGLTEVDTFEIRMRELPVSMRSHPHFQTAEAELRHGYDSRRDPQRAPYGSRKGENLTAATSRAIQHAQRAAQLLGLEPPAPKVAGDNRASPPTSEIEKLAGAVLLADCADAEGHVAVQKGGNHASQEQLDRNFGSPDRIERYRRNLERGCPVLHRQRDRHQRTNRRGDRPGLEH